MKPVLAIVGRPNVGKSTLFNRLTGRRDAIVEDTPGVTRDRQYGEGEFFGKAFIVIDTGGFEPTSEDILLSAMRDQAQLAIDEADAIIVLFDARSGLLPADEEIYRMLQRSGRKVFFAVNKVDGPKHDPLVADFYALGIGELWAVSAQHGAGVGDFIDAVLADFPETEEEPEEPDAVARIAVIGKPNAGKSTLVNRLLAEERLLTSNIPGTTRDSIDTWLERPPDEEAIASAKAELERVLSEQADDAEVLSEHPKAEHLDDALDWDEVARAAEKDLDAVTVAETLLERARQPRRYLLIDTAGVRRKRSIRSNVERYSVAKAFKSIDRAEVCLLMVDATVGVTDQDARLAGLIQDKGRACVVLVNKWDLVTDKDTWTAGNYVKHIREQLKFLRYAPVLFISALDGKRVHRILAMVDKVRRNYYRRVSTGQLNRFLERAMQFRQPPIHKNRRFRIYYATMIRSGPPTLLMSVNNPDALHFSYERYLMNQVRATWDFDGTPVRLIFRRRAKRRRHT